MVDGWVGSLAKYWTKPSTSFSEKYIRAVVKLEIGPLAIWVPNSEYEVSAYVSEEFPKLFENNKFKIRAIQAERTFWEKVTILHHEAVNEFQKPQNSEVERSS